MALSINQRSHHLSYRARIEDGEERDLGAERVPKTESGQQALIISDCRRIPVERVKVRFRTRPQRVLARVVLRIHHCPVDATIEVGENRRLDAIPRHADRTHFLCPLIDRGLMRGVEIKVANLRFGVGACLLGAEEAQSDASLDNAIGRRFETDKATALSQ